MGSPMSPIAVIFFMKDLEQQAMKFAPDDLRPKLRNQYVDVTVGVIEEET